MQKSTYMPKKGDQDRRWLLVDLDGAILGRAATRIANLLRGKHKASFTPHMDMGDFVVAINASKIRLTGKKLTDKLYYRHSGYPGGLKTKSAEELLEKKPSDLIRLAVSGMLPKNKSRKHLLRKLRIYTGTEHPHEAQQPEPTELIDKKVAALVTPKAPAAPPKKKATEETTEEAAPKAVTKTAEKKAAKEPAKKAAPKETKEEPAKKAAASSTAKTTPKKTEKVEPKATKK